MQLGLGCVQRRGQGNHLLRALLQLSLEIGHKPLLLRQGFLHLNQGRALGVIGAVRDSRASCGVMSACLGDGKLLRQTRDYGVFVADLSLSLGQRRLLLVVRLVQMRHVAFERLDVLVLRLETGLDRCNRFLAQMQRRCQLLHQLLMVTARWGGRLLALPTAAD